MNAKLSTAALAAVLLSPLAASADPLAIHRVIVNEEIQDSLQSKLQQQEATLRAQQRLLQLESQQNMSDTFFRLQQIQVQQQLILLQAEMRALQKAKKHKP